MKLFISIIIPLVFAGLVVFMYFIAKGHYGVGFGPKEAELIPSLIFYGSPLVIAVIIMLIQRYQREKGK